MIGESRGLRLREGNAGHGGVARLRQDVGRLGLGDWNFFRRVGH